MMTLSTRYKRLVPYHDRTLTAGCRQNSASSQALFPKKEQPILLPMSLGSNYSLHLQANSRSRTSSLACEVLRPLAGQPKSLKNDSSRQRIGLAGLPPLFLLMLLDLSGWCAGE